MVPYEEKAKDYYGEVVINKGLISKAGFGARSIPVYVGEWIVSQFMDGDTLTEDGRSEIVNTVSRFMPQKADRNTILNRLMDQEEVRILDDFRVNVNIERHTHDLSIPLLDVINGMVQKDIIDNNPMLLKTGMWGLGTLRFVPPNGEDVKIGSPYIPGAKVSLEVVKQFKDTKDVKFIYRKRKDWRKKQGHRQELTALKVAKISA